MTIAELRTLVERLSFAGGLKAWGCAIELRTDSTIPERLPQTAALVMHFLLPDRDTGEPVQITNMVAWDSYGLSQMTPEYVTPLVWKAFRDWMMHELGESLLLDGKRLHDPHENEKRLRSAA